MKLNKQSTHDHLHPAAAAGHAPGRQQQQCRLHAFLYTIYFTTVTEKRAFLCPPQLLLATPEDASNSSFSCQQLSISNWTSVSANLKMGLAATLVHTIGPDSPLHHVSLDAMAANNSEVRKLNAASAVTFLFRR